MYKIIKVSDPLIRYCFLIFVVISISGCSISPGGGFKTSDKEIMLELEERLRAEKIPFFMGQKGFINYEAQYKKDIDRILEEINAIRLKSVYSKYDRKATNSYLLEILNEKGIKYRIVNRDDGEWIRWQPVNREQVREIGLLSVERSFKNRKNTEAIVSSSQAPSNKSLKERDALKRAP